MSAAETFQVYLDDARTQRNLAEAMVMQADQTPVSDGLLRLIEAVRSLSTAVDALASLQRAEVAT